MSTPEQLAEFVHLAFYAGDGSILQEVHCARGQIDLQNHPSAVGYTEVPPGFPRTLGEQFHCPGGVLVPRFGAAIAVANGVQAYIEQAQALLAQGVTVTAPAGLAATYAIDATSQQAIMAEMISLLKNGTFTDGSTSFSYPDVANVDHSFSVAQFESFATQVASIVSAATRVVRGKSIKVPSGSISL